MGLWLQTQSHPLTCMGLSVLHTPPSSKTDLLQLDPLPKQKPNFAMQLEFLVLSTKMSKRAFDLELELLIINMSELTLNDKEHVFD